MRVAVKPVITTSVALVGASVIAVTPIQAQTSTVRVIESDVSLSASSVAYVPVNMIQQALSAPANMVAALDRLAAAMVISGSWNENHANNQWGWDEANPAMLKELINTLIPFPAFSEPFGRHLNWWATANLPMYEGCNYDCPDLPGMLDRMFKVPMSEFYDEDGYTFPVVKTPFNGVETPWSEETVKLDPAEPIRALWDSLTAEPTGVRTTTWWEVVTAVANFSAAMQITGHMPDWVAVREIERFFKHFLRPPVEEEAEGTEGAGGVETLADAPDLALVANTVASEGEALGGLSPAPALRAVTFGATGTSGAEDSGVGEAEAPSGADDTVAETDADPNTGSHTDSDATSIVDTATNFLKGKFATAQQDEAELEKADVEEADAADDADAAQDDDGADNAKSTGSRGSAGSGGSDSGSDNDSDSSDSGSAAGSSGSGGGDSGGDS
ncbi:hypothetical protein ACAG24_022870 [Mycobacterium sp. pW049]|uniref:hypothetical protein n=1 Tax=[Mycobacterium] bulgaricum TaxID=3238985 RepID=UPI00351B9CF6